jgi:hypothetical protein
MPRPTTAAALSEASQRNFAALLQLVDGFSREQRTAEFAFADRDRNVRDVLAHLHHWHLMMLGWYADGSAGRPVHAPAPGHTWRTLPALNAEIWAQYQDVPLDQVREQLQASHDQLQALIGAQHDPELFTKKHYAWTGSTSLGAYLVSSTSSHYDWAITKLRKHQRSSV